MLVKNVKKIYELFLKMAIFVFTVDVYIEIDI